MRRRNNTLEAVPIHVPRPSLLACQAALVEAPPPLPTGDTDQALGLLLVALASIIFGTAAMLVKLSPLSGLFLMQIRCTVQWVLSVLCILVWRVLNPTAKRGIPDMLFGEPAVRGWVILRSLVHWAFMVSYWMAARRLPFGTCTALVYVGPLFTSLPAYVFLDEHLAPQFLIVAPLSLFGLLLIAQPSFLFGAHSDTLSPMGLILAVVAATCLVILPIITKCGRDSHWLQIEHGSTFLGAFVLTPAALWLEQYLDPSGPDLWLQFEHARSTLSADHVALAVVLLIPCAQFVGLAFQTVAYQIAEAGKCSLMLYLMIPQSYVMQYLVFHTPMTLWANVGMAFIVGACAINGWETVKHLNPPADQCPDSPKGASA